MSVLKAALRNVRHALARLLGGVVAVSPGCERPFIALGQTAARLSRLLGTVYWFAEDDLIYRLRASGHRFRRLTVAGVDMLVDVTDGSARLHYFHGEPYEPELAALLGTRLHAGDVFVDVGANIGFFSTLAARLVGPSGRVVAFEPHPGARAILEQAISANGCESIVEIIAAAVGAAEGRTSLFLSVDSVLSTTDPARAPSHGYPFTQSIDVPRVTLDGWFRDHGDLAGRIALVKIDVEGTEADVIEGMREMLAACPRAAIAIETSPGSAADRALIAAGYSAATLDIRSNAFGNYLYVRRGP
jgi:FkbM family methyltransferase